MKRAGIVLGTLLLVALLALLAAVVSDPVGMSVGYARWRLERAGFVQRVLEVPSEGPTLAISYFERNPDAPRAALLIHGLQDNAGSWFQTVEALEDFHVLVIDLPGHGDSGPTAGAITQDHLRASVVGVAALAGTKPLTVVGNSLGGYLALAFAIAHPGRVDHLVPINAGGMPMSLDAATFLPDSEEAMGRTMRKVLGPQEIQPPGFVLRAMMASIHNGPTPRMWDALTSAPTLEASLPTITSRTDVFWGDVDGLIPLERGEAMTKAIPGARLHVLKACGHSPQITCPDAFLPAFSASVQEPKHD